MKQYIVIGAGRFGSSLAQSLEEDGQDVLVIDNDEEKIQNLSEVLDNVAIADASDEHAMRKVGLKNFDVAIIAMGSNLRASIMATLLAKEAGVPFVISKATDNLQAEVLRRIGADRVVFPEHDMGVKVAKAITFSNLVDYMELDDEHSICEMHAPKKWEGRSLLDLDVRGKYSINVIAIKKGQSFEIPPDPNAIFESGDMVVIAGKTDIIEQIALIESGNDKF